MQIRANQKISLLNLNAGNITYFLHSTVSTTESSRHFAPSIFLSPPPSFLSPYLNQMVIKYRRHRWLYHLASQSSMQRTSQSVQQIAAPVLFIVTSDLHTVLSQTQAWIKSDIYNRNDNLALRRYDIIYPFYVQWRLLNLKICSITPKWRNSLFLLENHSP